ncbi:MAG: glycosylhydrolase-like jelly roll fold domain-containing protein, partial [Bryobacteraceae bacterium]
MERIEQYARGGGVVIALERIPGASTGLANWAERDARVRSIASRMFARQRYGAGYTYLLDKVMYRRDVLDWKASVFDPFLKVLRVRVPPDVTRDFVREDIRENTALLFAHRRGPEAEVYFLTNLQDRPLATRLTFRVAGRQPYFWDPLDGEIHPAGEFESLPEVTKLPVRLGPYGSIFVVFAGQSEPGHITSSNFDEVTSPQEALAGQNGKYYADARTYRVEGLPAAFQIGGPWEIEIGDVRKQVLRLESWTEDPATRHFSGTATYRARFELPPSYLAPGLRIRLTLGDVGNVGEVELNGRPAGVIWIRGQALEVAHLLKPGTNVLTVKVTNTLINRVA